MRAQKTYGRSGGYGGAGAGAGLGSQSSQSGHSLQKTANRWSVLGRKRESYDVRVIDNKDNCVEGGAKDSADDSQSADQSVDQSIGRDVGQAISADDNLQASIQANAQASAQASAQANTQVDNRVVNVVPARAVQPWARRIQARPFNKQQTSQHASQHASQQTSQQTPQRAQNTQPPEPKPYVQKLSIGIACVRVSKNQPQMLMIKKRYSYSFGEFVHGKYTALSDKRRNPHAKAELIELFSGMTVEEKLDLLGLDFDQIWYRVWLSRHKPPVYYSSRHKFEESFLMDKGVKLRKLINRSANAQLVWEIPKGKKKYKGEPDITCAIREFEEETNIPKSRYKFIPTMKKEFSHIDKGVQYRNVYYIAVVKRNVEPEVNFNIQSQLHEISDIKWMDINEVQYVDNTKMLTTFVRGVFKIVKKYNKGLI